MKYLDWAKIVRLQIDTCHHHILDAFFTNRTFVNIEDMHFNGYVGTRRSYGESRRGMDIKVPPGIALTNVGINILRYVFPTNNSLYSVLRS